MSESTDTPKDDDESATTAPETDTDTAGAGDNAEAPTQPLESDADAGADEEADDADEEEALAAMEAGFTGTEPPAAADKKDEDGKTETGADDADEETETDDAADAPADAPAAAKEPAPKPTPEQERIRKLEGHLGALNAQMREMAEKLATRQTATTGADAPSAKQLADAKANADKLAELREQFPEWYEALDVIVKQQVNADQVTAIAGQQSQAAAAKVLEQVRLEIAHPDWNKVVESKELLDWYKTQDEKTQALFKSDKAADVVAGLDAYKKHVETASRAATRAAQREASKRRLDNAIPATAGGDPNRNSRVPSEEEAMIEGFNRVKRSGG